jgi:O-antigen/teichoic acid export membrane protein
MEAAPGSLGREAGLAVRWNSAAALATLVSQLAQILFLARWLEPAEFGLAAAALAVSGFLQGFGDLGLTHALVQRPALSEKAWASAWWGTLLAGLALAALLAAGSGALEGILRLEGLTVLLLFAAATLPLFGPASVFQARLQRNLRFRALATGEIAASIASIAAAMAWALWRRDAGALIAGQVALVCARCVALGWSSGLRPFPRFRPSELRALSAFGGFQMGERALNFAAGNLDKLLVARLLGPASAGYYTLASQLALRPLALAGPFVSRTLLPLFARIQDAPARLADSYLRSLSLLAFLAAGLYALVIGLADPLVRVMLGAGWDPAVAVLRILAVLGFLALLGNALGNLALALGKAGANFGFNALALLLRVAGISLGAWWGGLQGVALGVLAATLLTLPIDVALPKRWLGIPSARTLGAMGWALPAAALAAAGGAWLCAIAAWPAWVEALVFGGASATLFGGACLAFFRARWRDAWKELAAKLRR